MTTIYCNKECQRYKTNVISVGPGGQADLGAYCNGEILVTQVPFRRGRLTNRFDADYSLKEKALVTPCISPELKRLI